MVAIHHGFDGFWGTNSLYSGSASTAQVEPTGSLSGVAAHAQGHRAVFTALISRDFAMYIYICIYIYVCVYNLYIYMYIYMYIYIYVGVQNGRCPKMPQILKIAFFCPGLFWRDKPRGYPLSGIAVLSRPATWSEGHRFPNWIWTGQGRG
jgi:hypothetical protein